jgi:hypothetical protein
MGSKAVWTSCSQCGRDMKAFLPGGLHSREFMDFVVKVCGKPKCLERANAAWEKEKEERRKLGMSEALAVS